MLEKILNNPDEVSDKIESALIISAKVALGLLIAGQAMNGIMSLI